MGAQQTDNAFISITSGAALEPHRRVKLNSSNKAVYAGAGEDWIGVTQDRVAAADEPVLVKLKNGAGTFLMTASAAITAGARVYGTANGKIDDVADGACVGIARAAASGDNSEIEVMPEVVNGDNIFALQRTVTSGEAAANSNNGRADIDTGFGAAPALVIVMVTDASTKIQNSGYVIDTATPGAGVVRIDGIAAGLQLDQDDVINIIALRSLI